VFLRVIRDSLFGGGFGAWRGSNLLLPRRNLGALLPEAAQAWLEARGATLRLGARVEAIGRAGAEGAAASGEGWTVDGVPFDAVIVACPPWEAQRLLAEAAGTAWLRTASALDHEAIATVYAVGEVRLPRAMLALRGGPAQFVFDRSQLDGHAGLLAFVVSASGTDRQALQDGVVAQAASYGWQLEPVQTVVEKRATFACVPGMQRPAAAIARGLVACGDYIEGPYPATIEGAVRSGLAAAAALNPSAAIRTAP
jgi:predicted NAD/FAD-dependent oxidoreductase